MDMMSYLMGRNSGGGGKGAKIEVVTELPETGEANVIYLVPKQDTGDNDVFDEYLYVNDDWELIGSTAIDISGKQDTMQFNTMPNASVDYLGKIVQYTGTTNANYTNGYFYVCVGTTENDVTTYSWSNIDVQNMPDLSNYNKSVLYLKSELGSGYNIAINNDGTFTIGNAVKSIIIDWLSANVGSPVILCLRDTYDKAAIYFFINVPKYTSYSSIQFNGNCIVLTQPQTESSNINNIVYYGRIQCGVAFNTTTGVINNFYSYNGNTTKIMNMDNFYQSAGLPQYNTYSSTTYQINDYVYHNNLIYKCKTADTTGNWDSSKWTQVTYMEYLSDKLVGGALNGSY